MLFDSIYCHSRWTESFQKHLYTLTRTITWMVQQTKKPHHIFFFWSNYLHFIIHNEPGIPNIIIIMHYLFICLPKFRCFLSLYFFSVFLLLLLINHFLSSKLICLLITPTILISNSCLFIFIHNVYIFSCNISFKKKIFILLFVLHTNAHFYLFIYICFTLDI